MSVGVESFVVAGAIGFVLGFERERHAWREGERSTALGTRTFSIVALTGAVAGALSTAVVAVGLVGVCAVVAVGYWRTSKEHRGLTTEMAAIVTYMLGAYTHEDVVMAAGLAVAIALLLEQKSRLRHLLRDVVTDIEVDDALRYFAMAVIVLPLLPDRAIDRWEVINPRQIWELVVLLGGIGWVGHVATRVLGARRGLVITGLASGFVSGSATTAVMARTARQSSGPDRTALAGALMASVATCIQMAVITTVVDRQVGAALAVPLAVGAVVLAVEAAVLVRGQTDNDSDATMRRPLQLGMALVIASVLTLTLLVSAWLQDRFGSAATVMTAGVAGLADTHAAALGAASLVDSAGLARHTAILAIGAALGANTLVKVVLAHAAGGRRFGARYVMMMAAPIALVAVGLVIAAGTL